ncbi:MAG: single-stranded-DNA-specific exonuclease RecJ, partial [Candidatus Sericytochromatia bacterium]|nr:single-stranded-DNA-specific exonuclease RecJ [Candidatus Sericytochromatia bacterium]
MKSDFVEWNFKPLDHEKASQLSESVGISIYTAQLLINRGINTSEEAQNFLKVPHHLEMESWDTKTSHAIGLRLIKAIQNKEKITVHGDYDVDGVTGAGVLAQFLKSKGANFDYFLPDRFGDGYGVSSNTIKNLFEQGTKILITADCGISNNKEVDLANSLGMEVIITDHHTLPEILPNALYIFHPGLSKDEKFHILSGVGTAFQLIHDINDMIPSIKDIPIEDYLDLVTIGTIADISPLKGINRSLVQYGLNKIKNTKRLGLLTLMENSGIKTETFSTRDISHKIVPRLNAAGRMNKATLSLELLLSETEEEAQALSKRLEELNKQRQELCETTLVEIEELIEKEVNLKTDKAIVVAKEGFHHGVIGILCSRVVEKYHRPVFIMAIEGEHSRGSARSTNVNLVNALKSAESLVDKFGGHHGAAGWSLKTDNLEDFRKQILLYMSTNLNEDQIKQKIEVEVEIPIDKIDYYIYRELQELEPFGLTNPEPTIGIRDCQIDGQNISKNGSHLFFQALGTNKSIKTNFWYGATSYPLDEKIDMIYSVMENSWQGRISLQLKAKYVRNISQREEIITKKV